MGEGESPGLWVHGAGGEGERPGVAGGMRGDDAGVFWRGGVAGPDIFPAEGAAGGAFVAQAAGRVQRVGRMHRGDRAGGAALSTCHRAGGWQVR